jgi:Skp family chaperone for outer membrane proteins
MKHLFRHAILGLVLLGLLGGSAWAQTAPRIGTVDLAKIFDGYYKKKQAETIVKERATELENTIKGLVTKFEKDKAEYEKVLASANDANISPDERDKRKKQAEELFKGLRQSDEELTASRRRALADLDDQKNRMIGKLVDDIRAVVSAKARAAGFTLVLDTTAVSGKTGAPIVLFSDNQTDITATVLTSLNAGAPVDFGASSDDTKKPDTKAGTPDTKKGDTKKK